MIKTVMITGGAGFIGSNLVEYLTQKYTDYRFIVVDALTYAGDIRNLDGCRGRFVFEPVDITNKEALRAVFIRHQVTSVIHLAAESHVDNSIADSRLFANTNVIGTLNLLDLSRECGIVRFLHVSTDEVYGNCMGAALTEEAPIQPNNPYAASKAASDLLVRSYIKTHNFPAMISRSTNNYGRHQHVEKFIPKAIQSVLNNEPIPVYGDGEQIRDWIHVMDHCRAIETIMLRGELGEVYNIGAEAPTTNNKIAGLILEFLDKPQHFREYIKDRPGHDTMYYLNSSKLKQLGWKPTKYLHQGLSETVAWYQSKLQRST